MPQPLPIWVSRPSFEEFRDDSPHIKKGITTMNIELQI